MASLSCQEIEHWVQLLRSGDRRALARALTLCFSSGHQRRLDLESLLSGLGSFSKRSLLIGVSGPPGAGKSSFIEHLGCCLLEQDLHPAVLAFDPSSDVTGGSILGDKTRMEVLSRDTRAFVRPIPAGLRARGGIAPGVWEALFLCEAAGYDPLIIETVGAGQADSAIADLVDFFILIIPPASGDVLQSFKRGALERADLLLISKADGPTEALARETARDYSEGYRLLRGDQEGSRVHCVSVLTGHGFDKVIARLCEVRSSIGLAGARRRCHPAQVEQRLRDALYDELHGMVCEDVDLAREMDLIYEDIHADRVSVWLAARRLLSLVGKRSCVAAKGGIEE